VAKLALMIVKFEWNMVSKLMKICSPIKSTNGCIIGLMDGLRSAGPFAPFK
jgi:hypothetical protein